MSFHVPEAARLRQGPHGSDSTYGNTGAFALPSCLPGRTLLILASDGLGWEHVSAHVRDHKGRLKMPHWEEMSQLKNLFWDAEDCVMQLHPPRSTYVNNHLYTLHLWRPIGQAIPTPPPLLVGLHTAEVSHA